MAKSKTTAKETPEKEKDTPAAKKEAPRVHSRLKNKGKKMKYEPGTTKVNSISSTKDEDGNPIVREITITNR